MDSTEDSDSVRFCDLLEAVGLQQHVKHATHVEGHTLDLIITRYSDYIINGQPTVDRFISDHASVTCSLAVSKPVARKCKFTYRKLKSVDSDALRQDLSASILCTTIPSDSGNLAAEDIDALVQDYNSTLRNLTDRHAPLKTKTMKARSNAPWYSAEIDAAKRRRRKAERTWRKSKLLADFKLFKTQRNYVTHLINEARRAYYTDFINDNSDNHRKPFWAAKSLLSTKSELCFPNSPDSAVLCNDIGNLFVRKISRIREEVDVMVLDQPSHDLVPDDIDFPSDRGGTLTSFQKLSEDENSYLSHEIS